MRSFLRRHDQNILGVLSGFDRLRFRGILRWVAFAAGMGKFLSSAGVKLSDFGRFANATTRQVRQQIEQFALGIGRPIRYLPSPKINKEQLIDEILKRQGTAAGGWIAVLSSLEMCRGYDIHRDAQRQQLELVLRPRKCLHFYFYFVDAMFGRGYVRLQSWFPFDVRIYLNGREWLARQMDAARIGYLRCDNCFTGVDDFVKAQKLADRQPRIDWPKHLERLRRQVHPLHERIFAAYPMDYYWMVEQSEWATDVVFATGASLDTLADRLLRHGIDSFHSDDVMRFLGQKTPAHGGVHGSFAGQIRTEWKRRCDQVWIKHRLGDNSIKMYRKEPNVLRVETTINEAAALKSYRRPDGDPNGARQWRPLRKGVADIARRAQLSQSANGRYLEALADIDDQTPLRVITDKLCQPTELAGRRLRGLRPFGEDRQLLEAVGDGKYLTTGFRNRDIRRALFGVDPDDPAERRRQAARISYRLRLLRAHGLIKKIPRSHRYLLTKGGRVAITLLLAAQNANLQTLKQAS